MDDHHAPARPETSSAPDWPRPLVGPAARRAVTQPVPGAG